MNPTDDYLFEFRKSRNEQVFEKLNSQALLFDSLCLPGKYGLGNNGLENSGLGSNYLGSNYLGSNNLGNNGLV